MGDIGDLRTLGQYFLVVRDVAILGTARRLWCVGETRLVSPFVGGTLVRGSGVLFVCISSPTIPERKSGDLRNYVLANSPN